MHPSTASVVSAALLFTTSCLILLYLVYTLISSKFSLGHWGPKNIRLSGTTRSPWSSPQRASFPGRFSESGQPSEHKPHADPVQGQRRAHSDHGEDIDLDPDNSTHLNRRRNIASLAFALNVACLALFCVALGIVRILLTGNRGGQEEGLARAERVLSAFLRVSLSFTLVYALFPPAGNSCRPSDELSARDYDVGRFRGGVSVGSALAVIAFSLDIVHAATSAIFLPLISRLFTLILVLAFAGFTLISLITRRRCGISRLRRASYAHGTLPSMQEKVLSNGSSFIQWMTDSPASDTFLVPTRPPPSPNRTTYWDSDVTARIPLVLPFAVAVCALTSVCLELASAAKKLQGTTDVQSAMTVVQAVFLVMWVVGSAALLQPPTVQATEFQRKYQHALPFPIHRERAPSNASISPGPPSPLSLSFPRSVPPKTSLSITKHKSRTHRHRRGSSSKAAIDPNAYEASAQGYMEPSDITDLTDPFAVSSLSLAYTGTSHHSASVDQHHLSTFAARQYPSGSNHYPTSTLSPSTTLAAGSPFPTIAEGVDALTSLKDAVTALDAEEEQHLSHDTTPRLMQRPNPLAQVRERLSAQWGNIPTEPPPPEVRSRLDSTMLGDRSSPPVGLGVSVRGSSDTKESIPIVSSGTSQVIPGQRSPNRRGKGHPSDVFSPRKIKLESPPRGTKGPSSWSSGSATKKHVKLKKSLTLPSPLRAFGVLSSSGLGQYPRGNHRDHSHPEPSSSSKSQPRGDVHDQPPSQVLGRQTAHRASLSDLDQLTRVPSHLPKSLQEDAMLSQELLEALDLEGLSGAVRR